MSLRDISFDEHIVVSQHSIRFSLHEEASIWMIETGSIDLFAIERIDEKPEGKHRFLKEFPEGSFLFGFPLPQKDEIVAVAEPGTIFKKIKRENFQKQLLDNPYFLLEFLPFFNMWFGSLPSSFIRYHKEKEVHLFQATQKEALSLQKGEKVMFEHLIGGEEEMLINWVKVESGSLALLGWKDVTVQAKTILPLRNNLWWTALSSVTLKPLSPFDLIKEGIWIDALSQFHTWFLTAIRVFANECSERDKQLAQKRAYLEKRGLNESFGALLSVLKEKEKFIEEKENTLLLACQIIGQKLNLHFVQPKEKRGTISAQIADICDVSDVRYRQVTLTGKWFKEEGGNLLGFFGPKHTPVALLSNDRGQYTMINPLSKEKISVDQNVASMMASTAFEFYAPFSNEKLSWKQIFKFGYAKQSKKLALLFLITSAITILNLSIPFGSKIIFGKVIPDLDTNLLWQVGGALFVAAISSTLYQLSQGFLMFRINSLAGNRFEQAEWDRILKLPARFFKLFSVGDLFARLNGFMTIRRSFNNYYLHLILTAFFSFFYLIVMCVFSFTLTVVTVTLMAFALVLYYFLLLRFVHHKGVSYELKCRLNGFIVQIISGINKLRVSGAESKAYAFWAKKYAEAKKQDLKGQYYNVGIETIFAMIPTFSAVLIFSVVIYFIFQTQNNPEVMQSHITKGNFFGFISAYSAFSAAIIGTIPAITYFYRVMKPIWDRGKVIFETEVEDNVPKTRLSSVEGDVFVDQVFFRYDEKSPYVLKNISLKAYQGEFIGIVGPSGSGKSTLIRLLLGFEKPEKGSITYDKHDLAHLDLRTFRRQLGVVLQHGSILAGTIYENLVCGGIYSKEQVEKAIQLSGFDQDLWNFPMGLHTLLSSGGATLSGGQRQRLLIARALISNPKILLFDEATSALDNQTQERLSKNIEKFNVTRIAIAHRLSTLRHCDRIYVFDQGEIVDQGTFDELASHPGLFSNLVRKQKI